MAEEPQIDAGALIDKKLSQMRNKLVIVGQSIGDMIGEVSEKLDDIVTLYNAVVDGRDREVHKLEEKIKKLENPPPEMAEQIDEPEQD